MTSPETIAIEIRDKLKYAIGKDAVVAKDHDWLAASILVLRDHIIDSWMASTRETYQRDDKRVYYLSLEFLVGRLFRDAMSNLGLVETFTQALTSLGVDIDVLEQIEPDAALGNGGLGRLAACFMESMASLGIPAYGYGIRYEHGLFKQLIADGWQTETPETWLEHGNPWEFPRREVAYEIGFGGQVSETDNGAGYTICTWHPAERVLSKAHDTPIVGWKGRRVNTLRLWNAHAADPIQLDAFNRGDYAEALAKQNRAQLICRVLYPADSTPAGQELRLRQEYFFTSSSLQDILRRHTQKHATVQNLPEKVAIQLNDTHPAVAVAELMRLLIDMHQLPWDQAWAITQAVTAYTNHTLLPEALETWPLHLFERVLPRHMQIIYRINDNLLKQVAKLEGSGNELIASVSLIDEHGGRRVRMGQLAFVGSHSINGVSALHSELMKQSVFRDLDRALPGRVNNKTNGVTPRRWLRGVNPQLQGLLAEATGVDIDLQTERLAEHAALADDDQFGERFLAIKQVNKCMLAAVAEKSIGIRLDPAFMFDVQIKRMHEYKRQLLNILHGISAYLEICDGNDKLAPRVKIFAGKAAASYANAKLIIKLINEVASVVNFDSRADNRLKILFMPNYNVSMAEAIVPASDLSEQISTAGMEASGTGNMKLALNGALTIGTLDGANVEIREKVGADNFFLFGLTAEEVALRRSQGVDGRVVVERSPRLKRVVDALASGQFSRGDKTLYRPLVESLLSNDWFMVASDFEAYLSAQEAVDQLWQNQRHWTRKAVLNTLNMGWFSSDRTIRDYARDIWKLPA